MRTRRVGTGAALACALLAGCGSYRSGRLHSGDPSSERQVGCLDLRVTPHSDEEVDRRGWVAVRYELGNGCREAVEVALGRARLIRLQDGERLAPQSPHLVRVALLDGRMRGTEVLAYDAGFGSADYCVELDGIAEGAEHLQPVCFSHVGALEAGLSEGEPADTVELPSPYSYEADDESASKGAR